MKAVLEFISELKQNNTREWFEANKQRYLKVKEEHEALLDKVIDGIASIDPYTGRPATKDCVFRIYRDIRFSKDKQPYKEHIGAFISQGGRKTSKPGYYLHLDPGNCFYGGGIYMPPPDVLKKLRNEIYFDSDTFKGILEEKKFKKMFGDLYQDKLVKPPKDFDPEFANIDLLKYKSYFVERALTDEEVTSPDFVKIILETTKQMQSFQKFLYRAFEE